MSSERWQHLDRAFVDALQLSPDDRDRLITREAGRDTAFADEPCSRPRINRRRFSRARRSIAWRDRWPPTGGACVRAHTSVPTR
jgi:hypothetical protein